MKKYFCMAFFLLSACHSQEIKVKALRNVPGYNSTDAAYSISDTGEVDLSTVDFMIPKGSICFLGNEKYGKTDRFVEIRCENGLKGLVIEDEAFKPVE
ncbi:DNA mismatch repair protein MutS [Neisseria sp. Dent CA1/247]|uniref:DNA mismatch repair protein MutS n=1 Tax=unclassified Neisseria TaxID=2623750 RepID=UPI001FD3BBDF|nr:MULTISPECIES: DNA mismatch repair protein MutS [unclassified Neisseria]MDO1509752.1 DNA mismatch repair protein MutS [Neisseria sp. MVDL19-042950]MDO1515924.1 DNA mismatch repair protein MutS [Neisseria sp. MVDL18-041461]MDO1563037.1 DNA mismatch repair protein MutS [Neisseria sp. MVDL20-010259]UOO76922.1 DNA mismatch repair protein MutS [Neisseria sp. Dent CA1/247]